MRTFTIKYSSTVRAYDGEDGFGILEGTQTLVAVRGETPSPMFKHRVKTDYPLSQGGNAQSEPPVIFVSPSEQKLVVFTSTLKFNGEEGDKRDVIFLGEWSWPSSLH